MTKRPSEARRLYLAIANASDKNLKLLGMPEEIQRRLEVQLEGIVLPPDSGPRRDFRASLGRISINLLGRDVAMLDTLLFRAPKSIVDGQLCLIERRLGDLRRIAGLSQNSQAPLAFLRFLARPALSPRHFLGSAGNFSGARKTEFTDVPAELCETGKALLHLLRGRPENYLSALVRTLRDAFARDGLDDSCMVQEVAAFITRDQAGLLATLEEEHPGLYDEYKQHLALLAAYRDRFPDQENKSFLMAHILLANYGLLLLEEEEPVLLPFHRRCTIGHMQGYVIDDQEYFRKRKIGGFARGSIMVLRSDSDMIVQHELQHLFDTTCAINGNQVLREYRAKLAELAFSDSPRDVYRTMRSDARFGDFEAMLFGGSSKEPHRIANKRIIGAMRGSGIRNGASDEEFRGAALRLLNVAYKKACGLTYDQILEPFRKKE